MIATAGSAGVALLEDWRRMVAEDMAKTED
jgi:hypothetical protein